MSDRRLSAIILAAGAGTRMRSSRPKPLHLLCGKPMVLHVLDALRETSVDWVVLVVGHGAERVVKTLNSEAPSFLPSNLSLHFVEQVTQNGTGDAVSIALTALPSELGDESEDADVLVLPGDIPLLEPGVVAGLAAHHRATDAAATVLTVVADDPTGYGRVVRDKHNHVRRIVEQGDATEEERAIQEVNSSVYVFRSSLLGPALRRLTNSNAQGELYLTDAIGVLSDAGHRISTMVAPDAAPAVGVNDRAQLATAEAELRRRLNEHWMQAGVTMIDPATTYLDTTVQLAQDVTLLPGTRLSGSTKVGEGAEVGPLVSLVDCSVGARASVCQSQGKMATIGEGATVGPYVVLEPGAEVAPGAVVGPFLRVASDEEGADGTSN